MKICLSAVTLLCAASLLSCSRHSRRQAKNDRENGESNALHDRAAEAGPKKHADDDGDDEKAERDDEENRPDDDVIGEDCVAFLRATVVQPAAGAGAAATGTGDCPHCPDANDPNAEVLKFERFTIDHLTPSEQGCEVRATIYASFRPSKRQPIVGGLSAWIPADQRDAYVRGETPPGEQAYKVEIAYRRSPQGGWRALEFTPSSTARSASQKQ